MSFRFFYFAFCSDHADSPSGEYGPETVSLLKQAWVQDLQYAILFLLLSSRGAPFRTFPVTMSATDEVREKRQRKKKKDEKKVPKCELISRSSVIVTSDSYPSSQS